MNMLLDVEPEPDPPPAPVVDMTRSPVIVEDSKEQQLARRTTDLVARAQAVIINDGPTYEAAGLFLEQLKRAQEEIEAFFEDDVANAYKAWHGLTQKRSRFVAPIKEAHKVIAERYAEYNRAEMARAEAERKEREEQAKREEQQRLHDEAREREREAAELQAKAEEADVHGTREEALALREQAEQLEGEARELKLDAATAEAPVLPLTPALPTRKGAPKVRANWTFEVTDKMALCKAIARGDVSLECFTPNEQYLRRRAEADKATCRIPGVRVFDAGTVTQSRRT